LPFKKSHTRLIYRTLQRPGDILRWTASNIVTRTIGDEDKRVLKFKQSKTGAQLDILITPEIDECLQLAASSNKRIVGMTLLHKTNGQPYAEKSLSGMFAKAVREAGLEDFGLYDLKGKGATDMWLSGVKVELIQALCGHDSVTSTEIYVKSRWRGVIEPNRTKLSG